MTRTAVITGGSGFLGSAVVERYLEDGWRVVVPWVVEDEVPRLLNRVGERDRLELLEADVTDPDRFEAVVETAGEVHAAILLVGGFAMSPVAETDPGTWDRMVALNATSVFQASRLLVPRLTANEGGGSLVTVAAEPALDRGAAGMGAYAATKAAVVSLTRTLAAEAAEGGVNVNAIAPRIIDTPANRASMPDADTSSWLRPDEIARVIAFLTGDAGRIVNGSVLTLNRG
ncbi:MAG: SDR family NAD(P)-dependent oxidoreductase [Gemmatimonadota bacterium]